MYCIASSAIALRRLQVTYLWLPPFWCNRFPEGFWAWIFPLCPLYMHSSSFLETHASSATRPYRFEMPLCTT